MVFPLWSTVACSSTCCSSLRSRTPAPNNTLYMLMQGSSSFSRSNAFCGDARVAMFEAISAHAGAAPSPRLVVPSFTPIHSTYSLPAADAVWRRRSRPAWDCYMPRRYKTPLVSFVPPSSQAVIRFPHLLLSSLLALAVVRNGHAILDTITLLS